MMQRMTIAAAGLAALVSCAGTSPPAANQAASPRPPSATPGGAPGQPGQVVLPTASEFLVDVPHNWQRLPVNGKVLLHTVDPATNVHCFENAAPAPPALAAAGPDQVRQTLSGALAQLLWSGVFRNWQDVEFKSIATVEAGGWPESRAVADMRTDKGVPLEMSGVLTIRHGAIYSLLCAVPQPQLSRPHPEVEAFLGSFRPGSTL